MAADEDQLRLALLVARVDEMWRELRAARKDIDEMMKADAIAQAVADEMDIRREKSNRNISAVWMKAGIVGLFLTAAGAITQVALVVFS